MRGLLTNSRRQTDVTLYFNSRTLKMKSRESFNCATKIAAGCLKAHTLCAVMPTPHLFILLIIFTHCWKLLRKWIDKAIQTDKTLISSPLLLLRHKVKDNCCELNPFVSTGCTVSIREIVFQLKVNPLFSVIIQCGGYKRKQNFRN